MNSSHEVDQVKIIEFEFPTAEFCINLALKNIPWSNPDPEKRDPLQRILVNESDFPNARAQLESIKIQLIER